MHIEPKSLTIEPQAHVFMSCGVCQRGIIAVFSDGPRVSAWLRNHEGDYLDMRPRKIWPAPPTPRVPDAVPGLIGKLFLEAADNLHRGHADSAAPVLRRIVEISLKALHPAGKGSIYDRIGNLPPEIGVTPSMKKWAHQVRLLGNVGAHEETAVDADDTRDMLAFVEMFLIYAFELPARIAKRTPPAAEPAN